MIKYGQSLLLDEVAAPIKSKVLQVPIIRFMTIDAPVDRHGYDIGPFATRPRLSLQEPKATRNEIYRREIKQVYCGIPTSEPQAQV